MISEDPKIWFATLGEVRRQVGHIADIRGLNSHEEGQACFYGVGKEEADWRVCPSL